jgi:hypothetical protein
MNDLTWKCHVCGDERPDAMISVCVTPMKIANVHCTQNVRYCNDREACTEGAPAIRILKGAKKVTS